MLAQLKGVGTATENKLNELGIYTEEDLLNRIPKGYIDLSAATPLSDAEEGQFCLFDGKTLEIARPFKKGNLQIFRVTVVCDELKVNLVWFNHNYVSKILKSDEIYTFYGKLKIAKNGYELVNPLFEIKTENSQFFGIEPIYWTRGLIAQKTYRSIVSEALNSFTVQSIIDNSTEKLFKLMGYKEALTKIHNPTSLDVKKEKERIVIEKIVRRICAFKVAQATQIVQKYQHYDKDTDMSPFFERLPFILNDSQKDAVKRIKEVFCSSSKVNAILCGDVGSGKTAVAVAGVYFVVKNGYQAAVMAPTELLAKQHFDFINSFFSTLGISVCFLSGSTKKAEKEKIYNSLKNGEIDVIVGTHSLLNDAIDIPRLGFVVADEQHRFGVAQRTKLILKGNTVDVLTLSATPIPRSLQLVAYGEVEFISIGRRYNNTVKTALVPKEKRKSMWEYIARECQEGNQAYVVAPKIFDVEGIESESVEVLSCELKKYFGDGEVGVLHGKMNSAAKQETLNKFRNKEYLVLISTTVVEVGIDVPNAGIITIMDADKFGLSTLHQLRGRVGRNGQTAYCFLYTEKEASEGLKALLACNDGFELAEKDFELRGGGDIFGLEQSGGATLDGLNARTLKLAKQISDALNLDGKEQLLQPEIAGFSLETVSLN